MNQPFVLCGEDGMPVDSKIAPDLFGYCTRQGEKYRHPLRRNVCIVNAIDPPMLSTTLAIYRDERRVFLFPLVLGLSEQISANLGTSDSDFIEAVYRNTELVTKSYYHASGLSGDKELPNDPRGLVFVGICQSVDYDSLCFETPLGYRTWGGRYYFVKVTARSEDSELTQLLKTLNPPGGCVMAADALYSASMGRQDEKLVCAILKEPHRFFLNDFGSPTDRRFKHSVICKKDVVDYIDRNPQRVALGFGFRINYNMTNRLLPAAIRKERFVVAAYREALRRQPDLFACFGMNEVALLESKEIEIFLSHLEPMQIVVNGTRFHTPCGYVENYHLEDADKNPELTIETIRKALTGVVAKDLRTCGIIFDGLRQLFVPEVKDTNYLALKYQIPADREPLAFTDGLYMQVMAK